MKKMNRLMTNLFIVGGVLLIGAVGVPRSSGFTSSPGSGGYVLRLPEHYVDGWYMYRGQTLSFTFWGQTCPSEGNVTMLPVDCYVMNFEQYTSFEDNHSTQALLHVNSSLDSIKFIAEKNDYYFIVLEMSGPAGAKRCVGQKHDVAGLNLNFLQPALVFLISAIALLMYNLFQWLSIRGRKQVFQSNLECIPPPQEASKKGSK